LEQQQKLLNSIETWESNRFDWLAQLNWLSTAVPPSEDFMLTNLDISVPVPGKGKFTIKGLAKDDKIAAQAVDQMRDETHLPSRRTYVSKPSNNPRYSHQIDVVVEISHKGSVIKSDDSNAADLPKEESDEKLTEPSESPQLQSEVTPAEPKEKPMEAEVTEEKPTEEKTEDSNNAAPDMATSEENLS
jgi:hypothetical protein